MFYTYKWIYYRSRKVKRRKTICGYTKRNGENSRVLISDHHKIFTIVNSLSVWTLPKILLINLAKSLVSVSFLTWPVRDDISFRLTIYKIRWSFLRSSFDRTEKNGFIAQNALKIELPFPRVHVPFWNDIYDILRLLSMLQ